MILTVVATMLAGGSHIDHVEMLSAARADTREVLAACMRNGSAGSSRGVVRFADEDRAAFQTQAQQQLRQDCQRAAGAAPDR